MMTYFGESGLSTPVTKKTGSQLYVLYDMHVALSKRVYHSSSC